MMQTRIPWLTVGLGSVLFLFMWFALGPLFAFMTLIGYGVCLGYFVGLCWLLGHAGIFFTIVREGTAKIVVRGGDFDHILLSFKGHYVNDPRRSGFDPSKPRWEILSCAEGEEPDRRPWFMRLLGLHFLGWIPGVYTIYRYKFEWNELETSSKGGEKVRKRSTDQEGHPTDFVFVSDFNYVFVLEQAETLGNFSVDLYSIATIRIRNPYKALFKGQDWLKRTGAAVNGVGRRFVSVRNFDQVRMDQQVGADDSRLARASEFSRDVLRLNHQTEGEDLSTPGDHGLWGRYGAEIVAIDIQDIVPLGEAREAIQKRTIAEITRDTTIIESEGQAQAKRNLGQAQADALEARARVLVQYGHAASVLAQVDAMVAQGPESKVIWANSPFIQSQDNLGSFLDSLGVTPQQLGDAIRAFQAQSRR